MDPPSTGLPIVLTESRSSPPPRTRPFGYGKRRPANGSTGRFRPEPWSTRSHFGRWIKARHRRTRRCGSSVVGRPAPVDFAALALSRVDRDRALCLPLRPLAAVRWRRPVGHLVQGRGPGRCGPDPGDRFKTFKLGYKIAEVHPIPGTDHVLATGDRYNRVAVVRLTDGKDVRVLSHPRQANIGAVSPDGKYLMTASSGGLIHLRLAATGELVWPPQASPISQARLPSAGTETGPGCQPGWYNSGLGRDGACASKGARAIPTAAPATWPCQRLRVERGLTARTECNSSNMAGRATPGSAPSIPRRMLRPGIHPEPVDLALFSGDGSRLVVFSPEFVRALERPDRRAGRSAPSRQDRG